MQTVDEVLNVPKIVPYSYIKVVEGRVKQLKKEWGQNVVVKFGITGTMTIPNFQIETVDGDKKQAFRGELGKPYGSEFNPKKMTRAFSSEEYAEFMKVKLNR